ncbi:MAG: hypothetical protein ACWGPN_04235, partial [Gammaproteobacteria bacterium]
MEIYLVGGAVRNQLLGIEVREHDWVVAGAPPSSFVTVSGLALHMESADHGLLVTATSPDSTFYQVFRTPPSQRWSIQVPSGMPFTIIGLEGSILQMINHG